MQALSVPTTASSGWGRDKENDDDDDEGSAQLDTLNHAILVMRTCLSGLDLLIEKSTQANLTELLMEQRQAIHGSLDVLVREKVRGRQERDARHSGADLRVEKGKAAGPLIRASTLY